MWPIKSKRARKSTSKRLSEDERRTLAFEEIESDRRIVGRSNAYPPTPRRSNFSKVLCDELKGNGYPQVMVFTQFTDTMDYLRDQLVARG